MVKPEIQVNIASAAESTRMPDRWSLMARIRRRLRWVSKQLMFNLIFTGVLFLFTSLFMIGEVEYRARRKVPAAAWPVPTIAADTAQKAPREAMKPAAAKPPASVQTQQFVVPGATTVRRSQTPAAARKKPSAPPEANGPADVAPESDWLDPNMFERK
jgi:hypothetical protein